MPVLDDDEWVIIEKKIAPNYFSAAAMVAPKSENPITAVCIVSDKKAAPPGFEPITKAQDDPSQEADVWKDGFFAMSRVYRYICLCRTVPQNAFVCNVVADVAIVNEKDLVPPGFVPIEFTEDTREKALRKKQLCIRSVSRDSAVDAVSDIVILTKSRRPPQGYTLAGELDGLLVCFKYSVIPPDFPSNSTMDHSQLQAGSSSGQTRSVSTPGMYPGLPYPVHPGSASNGPAQDGNMPKLSLQTVPLVQRSNSALSPPLRGVDGIPFELNPRIKAGAENSQGNFPSLREFTPLTMEAEFSYPFRVEQQVLEQSLTFTP